MQPIEPLLPWDMGAERPRWSECLLDQTRVLIRPIRKEDAAAELAFIEALSPQARRNRFLGQVLHPGDATIAQFTDLDYDHDIAFAALLADQEHAPLSESAATAPAAMAPPANARSPYWTNGRTKGSARH